MEMEDPEKIECKLGHDATLWFRKGSVHVHKNINDIKLPNDEEVEWHDIDAAKLNHTGTHCACIVRGLHHKTRPFQSLPIIGLTIIKNSPNHPLIYEEDAEDPLTQGENSQTKIFTLKNSHNHKFESTDLRWTKDNDLYIYKKIPHTKCTQFHIRSNGAILRAPCMVDVGNNQLESLAMTHDWPVLNQLLVQKEPRIIFDPRIALLMLGFESNERLGYIPRDIIKYILSMMYPKNFFGAKIAVYGTDNPTFPPQDKTAFRVLCAAQKAFLNNSCIPIPDNVIGKNQVLHAALQAKKWGKQKDKNSQNILAYRLVKQVFDTLQLPKTQIYPVYCGNIVCDRNGKIVLNSKTTEGKEVCVTIRNSFLDAYYKADTTEDFSQGGDINSIQELIQNKTIKNCFVDDYGCWAFTCEDNSSILLRIILPNNKATFICKTVIR